MTGPRAGHALLSGALLLGMLAGGVVRAGPPLGAFDLATTPPVERFVPEFEAYPANYAVAQDGDGLVYVGNQQGVLIFDGERWKLVPSSNQDIVRSLAWDGGERVYVGGYGAIGYLERDARGVAVLHDLTPSIPGLEPDERFADVWQTTVLPQGVFFRGLRHLFRYQPATGRITVWRHPTRFGALALDGDDVVLQFRPHGFRRLVGDGWQPIPGTEPFALLVERLVPLPDGRLLALDKADGWRTLRHGKVEPIRMPPGTLVPSRYTRGLALDDGSVVLATDDGQLHLLDLERGTRRAAKVGPAFISGLIRARDGGLLLSMDTGLYHVDHPGAWARLELNGVAGSLHGISTWGERLFVDTGSGLFERVLDADGAQRFVAREWGGDSDHDLLPLDGRRALVAENYALRLVVDGRARDLTDKTFYPRRLQRSRFDPAIVFVGTELGLAVVKVTATDVRVVFELDDPGAPNVTSIVETARGELYAGTERGGVRRLAFSDDWSALRESEALGAGAGLEFGRSEHAWVARFAAFGVVAVTDRGQYRLEGRRFVPIDLGGLAALRSKDLDLSAVEAPDGTRWAWDFARVWRQPPGGSWQQEQVEAVRDGAIERLELDTGQAVFVASASLMRFDPAQRPSATGPPRLRLASVERVEPDGTRTPLPLADGLRLTQGDFGIAFRFSTPELRRARGARYKARLVGYGEPFSEWSRSNAITYHRLEPGTYRMELVARDSRGAESELTAFGFEVVPRWYASPLARALWALLALGALAGATRLLVRRRTRRLAAETARLEGMVEARTRELADANRKLDTIAHLDGLTGIPNRRKLDEYLEQVWQLCGERERPLALLAIDVDRFKDYNDKHGHLAGDTLLKRLAPILTRNLRRTEDLAARYGGEEFLVVLPGADAEVARQVGEALREKVATSSLGATISVGVAAETPRTGRVVTELVALADAALYRAKEAGRNRVVVAGA